MRGYGTSKARVMQSALMDAAVNGHTDTIKELVTASWCQLEPAGQYVETYDGIM